jgi:hypothetical protein
MAKQENGNKDQPKSTELSPKKRRKRNKQQQLKKQKSDNSVEKSPVLKKKRPPLAHLAPIKVPRVQEPNPLCSICGKPIQAIAQAISGPSIDEVSHFDCVLRKIADDEKVMPPRKVSYIGKGTFAIVDTDEEGKLVFTKKIIYETAEQLDSYKKFVEAQKR